MCKWSTAVKIPWYSLCNGPFWSLKLGNTAFNDNGCGCYNCEPEVKLKGSNKTGSEIPAIWYNGHCSVLGCEAIR